MGVTWQSPKKNKKIIDMPGFLACVTHAKRVANTGVIQGEEVIPKVVPITKGVRNEGIFFQYILNQVHLETEILKPLIDLNP